MLLTIRTSDIIIWVCLETEERNSGAVARCLSIFHDFYSWTNFDVSTLPGSDRDVDAAARHITAMFSSCNDDPDKAVYHHFTTATDTANVQVVFHMVIDQIIKQNVAAVQLMWKSLEDRWDFCDSLHWDLDQITSGPFFYLFFYHVKFYLF